MSHFNTYILSILYVLQIKQEIYILLLYIKYMSLMESISVLIEHLIRLSNVV